MKSVRLGTSSTHIPKIGLGAMGFGGWFQPDSSSDPQWIDLLRQGIDLGLSFIDTAEVYGGGHCEELVGKAIEGRRDSVFISTKFSPENAGYDDVLRSAESSLTRLGVDVLDLYQPHWPNPQIPVEQTMAALQRLIEQGKVRYAGLSNFSLNDITRARKTMDVPIQAIQYEYNLVDRTAEDSLIPFCMDQGYSFIAYSPLLQGRTADGAARKTQLQQIAESYGVTASQLTLAWLCRHPHVTAIPKTANLRHLKENARAADVVISAADIQSVSELFCQKTVGIPTQEIAVCNEAQRNVYRSVSEAIGNSFNHIPGPVELAAQLSSGEALKPIKIANDSSQGKRYVLREGRLRYWAWIIAFGETAPVPALIVTE